MLPALKHRQLGLKQGIASAQPCLQAAVIGKATTLMGRDVNCEATCNGVTVFTPGTTSNNPTPQSSVYTTGYRYVAGSNTTMVNNQDAFVVS
jgi:hypothetical protein